jgi:hypothetical protein
MKKCVILFVLVIMIFYGCSKNNGTERKNADGKFIENLVINAINGNSNDNSSLNNLIDRRLPLNNTYESLSIDSLEDNSGKKFYTVLLEYSNPAYNRFAVFDSFLDNYLIDKSLNGKISLQFDAEEGMTLIKVMEDFHSKDIFNLNRISFYLVNDTSVNLVFRTFTNLNYKKYIYSQRIDLVSRDKIKTTISSNIDPLMNGIQDEFIFNKKLDKYESGKDLFDKYVINKVNDFKDALKNPEITDEKSLLASVGLNIPDKTITNNEDAENPGFSIKLSKDWEEFKNFTITEFLNKQMQGTRYYNPVVGATISVIEIPFTNDAEDYINYRLNNKMKGKITIRNSGKIIQGKYFVLFFEFYCGKKKFLLIMKGSKFTFDSYKDFYYKIINSFSIDCNV